MVILQVQVPNFTVCNIKSDPPIPADGNAPRSGPETLASRSYPAPRSVRPEYSIFRCCYRHVHCTRVMGAYRGRFFCRRHFSIPCTASSQAQCRSGVSPLSAAGQAARRRFYCQLSWHRAERGTFAVTYVPENLPQKGSWEERGERCHGIPSSRLHLHPQALRNHEAPLVRAHHLCQSLRRVDPDLIQ